MAPLQTHIVPWDELCVTWAEVKQTAWPYQSTVTACMHPSAQLSTLIRYWSPKEKGRLGNCSQQLLRQEDEPAHGQHAVSASQTCPRGDTHNFLHIWGSLVLVPYPSSPTWLSCHTETVVPLLLLGLVPYHSVHRGPTRLYPVPPCSHWEGGWRCHSHHSGTAPRVGSGMHEALGLQVLPCQHWEKGRVDSLLHLCVCCLHVIPITATFRGLCSRVAWMLIKIMPAFMCLADKAGWLCSKFRLVGSCLRRQTQTAVLRCPVAPPLLTKWHHCMANGLEEQGRTALLRAAWWFYVNSINWSNLEHSYSHGGLCSEMEHAGNGTVLTG